MNYIEYKIAYGELLALVDDMDIPYATLCVLCDPDPIYDEIKGDDFESDIELWSDFLLKKLNDDGRWYTFNELLFNLVQELNNQSTINNLLTSLLPTIEMLIYRTLEFSDLEEKVVEKKSNEKENERYESMAQISEITNKLWKRCMHIRDLIFGLMDSGNFKSISIFNDQILPGGEKITVLKKELLKWDSNEVSKIGLTEKFKPGAFKFLVESLEGKIEKKTHIWTDADKGSKGYLASLLKSLHSKNYYSEKPSNSDYKYFCEKVLKCPMSIDTIKRTKEHDYDHSNIPYFN
ncbi:MAG: hypothetical protein ACX93O_00075 [Flagellimonas sp.]